MFNFRKKDIFKYKSPQEMYQDNKLKNIRGLLDYQGEMIEQYMGSESKKNIALELPTGSGKTLIGLLIGEYRRRKNKEIVLFLCTTKQLVNQVVNQASNKYGISTIAFCGKQTDYNPIDKTNFLTGKSIGVTTYSAFFTQHNIFDNVDLLIMDDVHSCEDYISSNWTVKIDKDVENFDMIANTLKDVIGDSDYERLTSDDDLASDINGWCNLVPITLLKDRILDLKNQIEIGLKEKSSSYFAWQRISENIYECNFYISNKCILIRPWIAPTMTYKPYANVKHRVLMSATLGKSGELERVTGLKNIYRLPIVGGWDKKGLGRRFFIMPDLSLGEDMEWEVFKKLHDVSNKKSVVLVPSGVSADKIIEGIKEDEGDIDIFNAKDLEQSTDKFLGSQNAMAILANRFDGIDFADNDSRMLFIVNLPKTSNIQESFLMSRMGASILFSERIRTRIIQAVGRCSRNPSDYSIVCILGNTIQNDLIKSEKLRRYPLELRAELEFGIDMSSQYKTVDEILEQVNEFLSRSENWAKAEEHIVELRDDYEEDDDNKEVTMLENLKNASEYELDYQYEIWKKDYKSAYNSVLEIIELLGAPKLNGYRSYWQYIAGSLAYEIYSAGSEEYKLLSIKHYNESLKDNISIKWIGKLITQVSKKTEKSKESDYVSDIIINIEEYLSQYFVDRKFNKMINNILNGLKSEDGKKFENGHKDLGELLGYISLNINSTASPDPYWIVNSKLCIVAEDKIYKNQENEIPVKHVKEAVGHEIWLRENEGRLDKDAKIITVFITNAKNIESGARTFAKNIYYLNRDTFLEWSLNSINIIREIRKTLVEVGDMEWRRNASSLLVEYQVTPKDFIKLLKEKKLNEL